MIFRKYGKTLHSVDPNFDPRAMNEIGFQKNEKQEIAWDDFQAGYQQVSVHELVADADGNVQQEAEQRVLDSLREQLSKIQGEAPDAVLLIESEMGKDYPKMRERISNVIVGNENKLHFHRTVEPPLRVGVYAQRKS